MRIGTSRADRLGFVVFAVLASLLAVLVVTNLNNDPSESAQAVATFADVAPPTAIPQTEALSIPEPTPSPEPITIEPAAAPVTDDEDDVDDAEDEEEEEVEVDASTADGDTSDEGTTAAAQPVVAQSANAEPAPAATAAAVPNPQAPADTAVPNPQLPEGSEAVPNPQLPEGSEAVPNPQLPEGSDAVPNPQPATQPVVAAVTNVPSDAPAGGTFTHTLSAVVARPTLHTTPGGSVFTPTFNGTALPAVNPTVFGNTLVYRVIAGAPGDAWAKVYVPARPNGTTAWVQTSQFQWGSSNRMLQINVSNNTVTVFEGSNVLLTTSAVTGKSGSLTPLANGWVEEVMAGPSSAYGPRLISLGIFSDQLNSFGGSIPKIALHGTNNPGLMGQYASNGCIRVENSIINQIAGLMPAGSKVIITG